MLKAQNASTLLGHDVVYVMEISLKQAYGQILPQIDNFQNLNLDSKQGQKKLTSKPQQKIDGPQEDLGFVFVDVQRQTIMKWIKKTQAALKKLSEPKEKAAAQMIDKPQMVFNSSHKSKEQHSNEQGNPEIIDVQN